MCDECLIKPCDVCGRKIGGANWHCPKCGICICLYCGIQMQLVKKGFYECPGCGGKLDKARRMLRILI